MIITTRMPAPLAATTESGTPSRSGSMEATRPMRRSCWRQASNFWSVVTSSLPSSYLGRKAFQRAGLWRGSLGMGRAAMASTRRALAE